MGWGPRPQGLQRSALGRRECETNPEYWLTMVETNVVRYKAEIVVEEEAGLRLML